MDSLGRNITLPIYNADGTSFHGLELKKFTFDSVVMALGDKITGELYYTTNTLTVAQTEYVMYDGVKYYLINPPTIVKEGMKADNGTAKGMTKYSFTFYHPMFMLYNFPFTDVAVTSSEEKYKSQDKNFFWIGNLVDYVAKLNKNLTGTEWVVEIGSNVPVQDKNKLSEVLSFNDQKIADALKTGYDTWEIPYIIDIIASTDSRYAQGKRFLIRYGLPSQEILVENAQHQLVPYVFQMGQGVGLKNDSRTPKNNKIVTRIAGYGSEDNVPFGYPQILWTGNQTWNYTINNSASAPNSYPIYDGIVAGQRVRLIHHPFTRSHLMPTIYADTVNKKVNPYASGYDPTIEIKDYYDAVNDSSWTYPNPIIPYAPSYEIHEFSDIKPELGEKHIISAAAFDGDAEKKYLTLSEGLDQLMKLSSETNIDVERGVIRLIHDKVESGTSGSGHQEDIRYVFKWSVDVTTDFIYVKFASSNINFEMEIHRTNSFPSAPWDDSMDDDGNYKQSYFNITLPQLDFDLYACAAVTQEMTINMRSGACLGCSFPVEVDWEDYKANFYDSDGNFAPTGSQRDYNKYPDSSAGAITIICKKEIDTFGTLMPNIYQQPKANDKFVILGISLPTSYITNAQLRLDHDMCQYMLDNNVHYFEWPLKFDEFFLTNHTNILAQMKPNILVRFNFASEQHELYIKQISVKYGEKPLPQYNITLTDDIEIVLSPIGRVTDEVSSLRVLFGGGGSGSGDVNLDLLSEYFLSKQNDDTAAGMIRFLRGLQVGENFVTGLLGEGGIFRVDDDGTTYIEADKLYIRMRAYFDTVEVKKYLHSGGNRIASKAGINCSRVEWIDANGEVTNVLEDTVKFRCYFRANGENGREITNDFVVNDLAFCKETNVDNTSIQQHGYWRCVIGVSSSPNEAGEHWIDLSKSDCQSGSNIPLAQDDIIQLGHKTDTTRQGAIVEFVGGEDGPSYQIYQGINSYDLTGKNYVRFGYDSQNHSAQAYIGNPDGSTYLWYHYVTEGGQTFPRLDIKANVQFTSPITHQDTTIEDFASAVTNEIRDLQEQIDGEIDTWFYEGTPTLNNAPASSWTTATEKERHLGDLYYDIGTGATGGFAYRFIKDENNVYQWQYLEDTAITEALAKAAEAYDLADHKRRVFYTTPTPPYDNGDLWVNAVWPDSGASQGSTYNDDILRCVTSKAAGGTFAIGDWTLASNYTDDSALVDFVTNTYAQDLANIETQVDAKAETWYQDSDPSSAWTDDDTKSAHVGDIWYDTSANGGKKTYIWRDRGAGQSPRYYWAEQAVPDVVFDDIDGKAAIYVTWNGWIVDNVNKLNDKDLFIPAADVTPTGSSVTYKANKVYRWDENSGVWREIAYTDDAVLNNFMNVTYANDKQNLQSQIDGKAETWRQTTDPANAWTTADEKAAHVGDLWMDTSTNGGKKTYIYQNTGTSSSPIYEWVAQDVPDTVFDEIDGKSSIFVTQPSNYKANDLWILAADTTVNGVAYKQGEVLTATQDSETYNQAHWTKKVCYTDDTIVNEIIAKYGQILNIQNPTAEGVGQAIGLLNGILKNSNTQIDGGLILTSAIYMKDTGSSPSIWAGISGVRQSSETGNAGKGWKGYGVAAWYGGGVSSSIPIDKECLTATEIADGWNGNTYHLRWARGLDRFDGSGYRADGNISWDASGNVTIQGYSINATTLQMGGSNVATESMLANYVTLATDQTITGAKTFGTSNGSYIQIGAIRIVYDQSNNALKIVGSDGSSSANFYATGGVSALGSSSSGGGGGISLNEPLLSINQAGLSAPTYNGSVLVYSSGWKYSYNAAIVTSGLTSTGSVSANGFYVTGKNDTYVVLAGGGTKLLSEIGGTGSVVSVSINGTSYSPDANGDVNLGSGYLTGYTDTKTTAGISQSSSKLYIIGSTQTSATAGSYGTTYTNTNCYIGTDGCLYSGSTKVLTGITSTMVTTALGFTPAASSDLANYLQKSGGTLTGTVYGFGGVGGNIGSRDAIGTSTGTSLDFVIGHSGTDYVNARMLLLDQRYIHLHPKVRIGSYATSTTPTYTLDVDGSVYATGFVTPNGTSSQFLKADGSVDSNSYAISSSLDDYLLKTGGIINGSLGIKYVFDINRDGTTGAIYNESKTALEIEAYGGYIAFKSYSKTSSVSKNFAFLNGKVGINISSPKRALDVDGAAQANLFYVSTYSSVAKGDSITGSLTANDLCFYSSDGTSFAKIRSYCSEFQINGNLGVGMASSPAYTLDVNGNARASSFIKNGGTSTQFLKADGSVDDNNYALASDLANYYPITGGLLNGNMYAQGTIIDINRNGSTGTINNTGKAALEIECYATYIGFKSYHSNSTSAKNFYFNNNVGIGTSSPSYSLDVNGRIYASYGFNTYTNSYICRASTITASLTTNDIAFWAHDGSGLAKIRSYCSEFQITGSLAVGKTGSPAYTLDVVGNAQFGEDSTMKIRLGTTSSSAVVGMVDAGGTSRNVVHLTSSNILYFGGGTGAAGYQTTFRGHKMAFVAGSTTQVDAMFISSAGKVMIGSGSAASYALHVTGDVYATGGVTALSDAREKNVIGSTNLTVEDIAMMKAVNYRWKDGRDNVQHVGSIAQDWQRVLPEVVMKADDEKGTLSLQYGVAALVSSIVTARKVVDHERRIAELERENRELKEKLKIA